MAAGGYPLPRLCPGGILQSEPTAFVVPAVFTGGAVKRTDDYVRGAAANTGRLRSEMKRLFWGLYLVVATIVIDEMMTRDGGKLHRFLVGIMVILIVVLLIPNLHKREEK